MTYYHVDVFSSESFSGNGLTVIFHEEDLNVQYMQKIAQEFKQFETIFLKKASEKCFRARIFTVEEELDFAGHPILGAVSAIHEKLYSAEEKITITLQLNTKALEAQSVKMQDYYKALMNQGVAEFLGEVKTKETDKYWSALNLRENNLHSVLPMEVVSTGLPYLIVPIHSGIENARIMVGDLEERLAEVNAKFVYILDVEKMEGRTWDNLGSVEDVATGSAAGPAGAYLYKWGKCNKGEKIIINQGRFVGRPSRIEVCMDMQTEEIIVSGDVKIIANGKINAE